MCTTVDRSFEVSANTGNIACLGLTCNREGKPGDLILMSKSARNEIHSNSAGIRLLTRCEAPICLPLMVAISVKKLLRRCIFGFQAVSI